MPGSRLRAEREGAGLSLTEMAKKIKFSKSLLGMVETGQRTASLELIAAYQKVLGVDMWRKDITHKKLLILTKASRATLLAGVERGDPGALRNTPTAHRTDVSLGNVVSEKAAEWFRKWAVEGDTATLRTNSLSVVAKLPGKHNADLVVQVLENDPKVRRLIVASEISRLTQLEWKVALQGADDPTTLPEPRKLAVKLAKGATNPKGTESRWACSYLLARLVSVLGR
ncbi:helix-turn-helix domain-containing protein [Amycolatopsis anabasis]|uniref:helix-turn-helix domain-containing protein n=1 Tax=Amycolatopsis anabasis TaxID=1840409 RepID=UPI001FE9D2E1|nr:helix-turn-helix transcriptional regulator [Amycolatopsis anabasis]